MIVVFTVKVTGSAEIVVTAGSSSDPKVVPADFLGYTIGRTSRKLLARGYRLKFVTDKYFVFEKQGSCDCRGRSTSRRTLFGVNRKTARRQTRILNTRAYS